MGCIDNGFHTVCGFRTHVVTRVVLQITRHRKRVTDEMLAMINSTIPTPTRARTHTQYNVLF